MLAQLISWLKIQQAFEFLAYVINHSPDEDFVEFMKDQYLGSDEDTLVENPHIGEKKIIEYFEEHQDTPVTEIVQELAVDFTRLFRGVSPTYGPPPPYEGVYRGQDGLGATNVQDVNKVYAKYGLAVSDQHRDRGDYLGYELNLVSYLSEQANQAQEGGRIEEEENYQYDLCQFMREHLSTWVGGFCTQAAEYAQTGFYSGFLLLLQETVVDVTTNLCSMSSSEDSYEK